VAATLRVDAPIVPLASVRAGVFLVRGPSGANVLIDAGMRGQHRRILSELQQARVAPESISTIAVTHWHIDHTGSLPQVQRATHARVAAHSLDAPVITGAQKPTKPSLNGEGGAFARWLLVKLYRTTPVDALLDDGNVVEPAGLRVVATPGHTPGHVCFVLDREGALFAGDALVHRRGEVLPPPRGFNQDAARARRSLQRLRAIDFDQCYFGHGEPILSGAKAKILRFLDQLAESAARTLTERDRDFR
jgi:glyoxylase-like metal-dependent hydrolase (beta-lactamase superfamily II)